MILCRRFYTEGLYAKDLDFKTDLDTPADELASAIRGGSTRALARGMSRVEAGGERAQALVDALYAGGESSAVWAHIVGVTGTAGAGKSTLVAALAKEARQGGITVGILAVDPSSPFTGGAILGDRVRMSELSGDSGVYLRSMAARGELGGLCQAAAGAIDLLRAAGKQLVLIETVGVGQDEVDIMRVAHTTVLVSVPGLGDDVQMMKAGLIEIADIHVVNKADREGASETISQIQATLALNAGHESCQPPVLPAVAPRGEGVAALWDAIRSHANRLRETGELAIRERRMAEARVIKLAQAMIADSLGRPDAHASSNLDLDRVARRELSPYVCARNLLDRARTS
jgi:LAO/AO transport system kinase